MSDESLTPIGKYMQRMGAEFCDGPADQHAVWKLHGGLDIYYERWSTSEKLTIKDNLRGEECSVSLDLGTEVDITRKLIDETKKERSTHMDLKKKRLETNYDILSALLRA